MELKVGSGTGVQLDGDGSLYWYLNTEILMKFFRTGVANTDVIFPDKIIW